MVFWLALFLTNAVAVDATGMPPQLSAIRAIAASKKWSVVCEGRAGEEGVIRMKPPANTDSNGVEQFASEMSAISTMVFDVSENEFAAQKCDRDEPITRSQPLPGWPNVSSPLAFGPVEKLTPLLTIARRCGYLRAGLRKLTTDDVAFLAKGHATSKAEWQVLDAGKDGFDRYGPAICFVKMGRRPLVPAQVQASDTPSHLP